MKATLKVFLGRTNVIPVSFGTDVSSAAFASDIRVEPDSTSTLIVSWVATFLTDGSDGEVVLTLDDADLAGVTAKKGYMDIKRIEGGEPYPVVDEVIEVYFQKPVTA